MNSYNKAFMSRCEKIGKALTELNQKGCAILSMSVNEKGGLIEILPPRNSKLTGVQTCIKGGLNGRQYLMQTRMHGCTVTWETEQQPITRHPL